MQFHRIAQYVASLLAAGVLLLGCSISQSPYSIFKSEAEEIRVMPWDVYEGSPCHKMVTSVERVIVKMADVADRKADRQTLIVSLQEETVLYNPGVNYSNDDEFAKLIERINDLEGAMSREVIADSDFSDLAKSYLEEYQSLKVMCSS